ncbi:cysteine-rich receptor-like protein kinase 2 isoform X2 [Selaginella moellendorffii]|uniref:cysteine-rich receptor-like protein kinase 2 isoform X2 n=1 Tax=Selaginella moellendorffii TaxID=88036 RepID=UPI000D1CCF6D|nr:cysteine-rich receptor-like protein kinase 2 isoform X2 [Selaginella moellendorffii]|eukprot:XP_024521955.1 cysteine-rich receptor-like protein kinase 2 isoform X2 [Selaginella moellendorffii]
MARLLVIVKLCILLFIPTYRIASGQLLTSKNSTRCSDLYTFTSQQYRRNIIQAFGSLANTTDYKTVIINSNKNGSTVDTVFGLLQCRGDISSSDCNACASTAIKSLNGSCVRNSTKGGRVQEETCFLRYEDHYFFSNYSGIDSALVNCSSGISNSSQYLSNTDTGFAFLRDRIPGSAGGFMIAVAGTSPDNSAYVLGQCVRDLSTSDCATCLEKARSSLSSTCNGRDGGSCYLAECNMQYESFKFFGGVPVNASSSTAVFTSGGGSNKARNVGIIVGVIAAVLLVAGIALGMNWRWRKNANDVQSTLHRGPVTFPYRMLKSSTANFDESHKLGEGGFGAVYKGYLPDGSEVAIKKLTVTSKHGELQFLNEVKAISNVQHRNLVRLLGCSTEGTERLLVYELLKNNSLENALFGPVEKPLSWETRHNILLGTARGLAYLHEDSQIRIVHRDIKPSNILLDEFYEAKIADFGLARLFESSHQLEVLTTKAAGTYGYMAPEYALNGQLSDKIDVYSYGIVILETVSGKRNRDRSLVDEAWQIHADAGGVFGDFVDPKLENEVSNSQALQLVTLALMCTQDLPQARPSMPHVVAMLAGYSNAHVPENLSRSSSLSYTAMRSNDSTRISSGASNESPQISTLGPR